jgi:hypothetical protein
MVVHLIALCPGASGLRLGALLAQAFDEHLVQGEAASIHLIHAPRFLGGTRSSGRLNCAACRSFHFIYALLVC